MRRSIPLLYLLIDVARGEHTRDAATARAAPHVHGGIGQRHGRRSGRVAGAVNLNRAPPPLGARVRGRVPRVGHAAVSDRARVGGSGSALAVLVGRYFYGQARKYTWIPDWRQFKLYWKHMKTDGLDCLEDPFIQAAEAPTEDPFASAPLSRCAPVAAPAVVAAVLKNAPLAGQAELDSVPAQGVISRGAKGEGVKALQQAVMALGVEVPEGPTARSGRGSRRRQGDPGQARLSTDGVVGPGRSRPLMRGSASARKGVATLRPER